jgi:hypothetical protein
MELDVYYFVDSEAHKIERVELSREGVITVRAGVSILRQDQLGQLAAIFGTELEAVENLLQNPPEPFVFADSLVSKASLVEDFAIAPDYSEV